MEKDSEYKSERLTYRGISIQDAELIVSWRSDPDNYQNFFGSRAITLDEHLSWFERYLDDSTRFDFMIVNEDGIRIGTVGLSRITDEDCEISYMIGDASVRGKGYAAESVSAMVEIAFKDLGVDRVYARIKPGNEASERVALAAGLSESERVFSIERA